MGCDHINALYKFTITYLLTVAQTSPCLHWSHRSTFAIFTVTKISQNVRIFYKLSRICCYIKHLFHFVVSFLTSLRCVEVLSDLRLFHYTYNTAESAGERFVKIGQYLASLCARHSTIFDSWVFLLLHEIRKKLVTIKMLCAKKSYRILNSMAMCTSPSSYIFFYLQQRKRLCDVYCLFVSILASTTKKLNVIVLCVYG